VHDDCCFYRPGRFPIVTGTLPLTVQDLSDVLHRPKNALLKQYEYFFALHHMELVVTPGAFRAIAALAVQRHTGARGLRSIMEKLLSAVMFHLPDNVAATLPGMEAGEAASAAGGGESGEGASGPDRKGQRQRERRWQGQGQGHTAVMDEDVVQGRTGVVLLRGDLSAEEFLASKRAGTDLLATGDDRVAEATPPVQLLRRQKESGPGGGTSS
jgi:hypothetical protein